MEKVTRETLAKIIKDIMEMTDNFNGCLMHESTVKLSDKYGVSDRDIGQIEVMIAQRFFEVFRRNISTTAPQG